MRKASPIAFDNFFMVGGKSMKSLIKSVSFVVILVLGILAGCQNPSQSERDSEKAYQPRPRRAKPFKRSPI